MMSDVLVESALSAAPSPPHSMANAAFRTSWPTTLTTTTLGSTSTSPHHAAITNTLRELVRDVDESWRSGQSPNTVREIARRNEKLLRSIRYGIGFGAAAFAILLIGAVYVGIRCCRKKPSDEEDSSSMEISGVQYQMREEYGPKPTSRCSTCDSDAVRAENSLRLDLGPVRSDGSRPLDIIERDGQRRAAEANKDATSVVNTV